ncbi:hypothetical protein ACOMHN_046375 [Nucella lapillus]
MVTVWILVTAVVFIITSANPLSFQNVSGSVDVPVNSQPNRQCVALDIGDICGSVGSSWNHGASLPNLYGQYTVEEAVAELRTTLEALHALRSSSRDLVQQFLCALYLPPCPESGPRESQDAPRPPPPPSLPLPCRPLCEMAREEVLGGGAAGRPRPSSGVARPGGGGGGWPGGIHCHMFPTDRCYMTANPGEVKYVIKALVASGTGANRRDVKPESVASLDNEMGDRDDTFDVQVITLGANQIPPRRYDLNDLGDPLFFHGWADVQVTGAANDYCRVIGRGKRRFLSCALAGTRGQDHHYVSRLGFDSGFPGTWFMRDVDSDGRDDYCRCTGAESSSRVVCMKAGEKGFYGSTFQGGSQYTFELSGRHGCHKKPLNPHFGR